jgi:hypothetical protein
LNVTKAWTPLKVILPKQAGISCEVLAVWTYLLTRENQYRFQVHTSSGKNLALDGAFQVDDVQISGSKMGC